MQADADRSTPGRRRAQGSGLADPGRSRCRPYRQEADQGWGVSDRAGASDRARWTQRRLFRDQVRRHVRDAEIVASASSAQRRLFRDQVRRHVRDAAAGLSLGWSEPWILWSPGYCGALDIIEPWTFMSRYR